MVVNLNKLVLIEKRKQFLQRSRHNTVRKSKSPKWLFPLSIEHEYVSALRKYFLFVNETIKRILFPVLPWLSIEATKDMPKTDSWFDNIDALIKHITLTIDENTPYSIESLTTMIGGKAARWNNDQWQKIILKVFGVASLQYEPWLNSMLVSFSKENVALIKSLKSKSISDIETMSLRSLREGIRHEEIAKQIEDKFKASESRAELIARDQVSKLNGQLTKTRQQSIGINNYIWMTSKDERVRGKPGGLYSNSLPSHWALEGKRCTWDNPDIVFSNGKWIQRTSIGGIGAHPGMDYQCRCWAQPIFEEF